MLTILGKPKRIDGKIIIDACYFALEFLQIEKAVIEICVEFEHISADAGYCDWDEDDRVATITLGKDGSINDLLKTLFHEFVHVKQFVVGDLIPGFNLKWRSEPNLDRDLVEYEDLPWEKEAFALENKLLDDFTKMAVI
jgi:hypothetical protein